MDLIRRLVEIESRDATYPVAPWSGSDDACAAHDAVEQRIEAIYDAAITIGIDGDKIKASLDGDES